MPSLIKDAKRVVLSVGLFFCFLMFGVIILSVVDVNLYPDASLRLTWWQELGLPVDKKIASYFLPKAKSKEDLMRFQPQMPCFRHFSPVVCFFYWPNHSFSDS